MRHGREHVLLRRQRLYRWQIQTVEVQALAGIEIKCGSRVASDAFGSLRKWQRYAGALETRLGVVYGGDEKFQREGVSILPWSDVE